MADPKTVSGVGGKYGFRVGRLKLGTVPFAAAQRQELQVQGGLPKDYFTYALFLRCTGRLTIAGGTTNGVLNLNSAPVGLVERVEISGNHKIYGDYTRLLLQGDHLFNLGNIYDSASHELVTGGLAAAVGTYDFSFTIPIYFVPPQIRAEEQLLYLLDNPLWNTLQLYVDWGAATSLVVGGDRTLTLSAFGSGAGSPSIVVHRYVAKINDARFALNPIPIKQTYKSVLLEAGTADAFITQINTGNFIRSLVLVTGTRNTGASLASRGDSFASLSDSMYTRITVKKDDIPVRNTDWQVNKEFEIGKKSLVSGIMPTGYNVMEFAEDYTTQTSFDTRDIALKNLRFELGGDSTAVVNQRLHVLFTELAGIPVYA